MMIDIEIICLYVQPYKYYYYKIVLCIFLRNTSLWSQISNIFDLIYFSIDEYRSCDLDGLK